MVNPVTKKGQGNDCATSLAAPSLLCLASGELGSIYGTSDFPLWASVLLPFLSFLLLFFFLFFFFLFIFLTS